MGNGNSNGVGPSQGDTEILWAAFYLFVPFIIGIIMYTLVIPFIKIHYKNKFTNQYIKYTEFKMNSGKI